MGLTFNRDGAMKAGVSEHITESGVQFGKLTLAVETSYESGAKAFEFEFVNNEGQVAKYLKIFTTKKDGTNSFGINHIYALMGLLKIANATPVSIDAEHQGYPVFCNKPIGIIFQRENKDEGKFQMNILHFIDPTTKKTFTEHVNNEEALEYKKEIKDKVSKHTNSPSSKTNNSFSNEQSQPDHSSMFGPLPDDLPF
jgi:hypothetical protein